MSLSFSEAEALFARMLDGEMSEEEIRDTLVTLADRGETAQEIAGAARAMRDRMVRVSGPQNAIDVCGTGGDGQHSLNISTAVALVVAACDVPVAKHGNRAASSKAGAADTLEALGLDLDKAAAVSGKTLNEIGITFLFAQAHHPAMKYVMPIRKALGRRTIFNLLGPIANPAGVSRQLIGIANPGYVETYRDAMKLLGMSKVMIVSGMEGLDEISIAGPTRIATIGIDGIPTEITPEDAGLPRHSLDAIRGGDAAFNAAALRRLLEGEEGAYRDAVLLNAAGALIVAGEASTWEEGVEEAAEAIDKGLAKALLDCWIAAAQ
ncbi:anthranilate phosphoribosyltransferase [Alteraurantiacibacter aquimixticola]|uniref:Anthranilate phosphoribosyltransferase n=1 Tax=Alteraurantiacibacter aquimixticola TaxID=2489173 RepID=A0A4V4U9B8_9SPHN|nr:anthranilate phosphoribosyltransferase [Alteraurantiacibacter aquimixticola]TIX50143.1 anthranilate phosphoribosyltransferase [Alteraurantiacibacter aquimixticola]